MGGGTGIEIGNMVVMYNDKPISISNLKIEEDKRYEVRHGKNNLFVPLWGRELLSGLKDNSIRRDNLEINDLNLSWAERLAIQVGV